MSATSKLITAGICLASIAVAAPVLLSQSATQATPDPYGVAYKMHADNEARRDLARFDVVVSDYLHSTGSAPATAAALHDAGVEFKATTGVNLTVVGAGTDYCLLATSRLGTVTDDPNRLGSSTTVLYLVDGKVSTTATAPCAGPIRGKYNSAGYQSQAV